MVTDAASANQRRWDSLVGSGNFFSGGSDPLQRGLVALGHGLASHRTVGGAGVAEAEVEARAVEDVAAAGARSLDQASGRGLERLEADGALHQLFVNLWIMVLQ